MWRVELNHIRAKFFPRYFWFIRPFLSYDFCEQVSRSEKKLKVKRFWLRVQSGLHFSFCRMGPINSLDQKFCLKIKQFKVVFVSIRDEFYFIKFLFHCTKLDEEGRQEEQESTDWLVNQKRGEEKKYWDSKIYF